MQIRAAVYTRLSRDPRGDKPNLDDQERRCREIAAARGWEVTMVIGDRDRTASGRDPHRPGYDQLRDAIQARDVEAVLALDQDRLVREPRELEALMELCEDARVNVITSDGELDATDADGRMYARVKAAFSANEVDKMSKRQIRAAERNALAGKRIGGGNRMFGYTMDMKIIDAEAKTLRDAVDALMAGRSLSSIVGEFNTTGVPTVAGGKAWTMYGVKRVLANPTIAGWVNRKGEAVAEGAWEAIITKKEHEKIKALLFDPNRTPKGQKGGRRGRTRALTGLLFCGKCGTKMIGRSHIKDQLGLQSCPPKSQGGCGGIGVKTRHAEPFLIGMVVDALVSGGITQAIATQTGNDDRAAQASEKLAELQNRLVDIETSALINGFSMESVMKAKEAITADIQTQTRVLASTGVGALAQLPQDRDQLAALFEAQSPQWRHDVMAMVVEKVIVRPSKGTNVFDPNRMEIHWRL